MRLALLSLIFILITALDCLAAKPQGVEIEMLELTGQWAPVITVHGFADNEAMARMVVQGLESELKKEGKVSRSFRIVNGTTSK